MMSSRSPSSADVVAATRCRPCLGPAVLPLVRMAAPLAALLLAAAGCSASDPASPDQQGDRVPDRAGAARSGEPGEPGEKGEGAEGVLAAPSAGHLMLRGKDLLERGNAQEALKLFKQAAEAGYDPREVSYYQGLCFQTLGDGQMMAAEFRKFLAGNPPKGSERARKALEAIQQVEARKTGP